MQGDALGRLTAAAERESCSFQACINLLSWIDELPADATGALTFEDGVVLVGRRRVCWAVSETMDRDFTELLCALKDPPLEPTEVEAVYRRCKRDSVPVGQALVGSGLVSERELRAALQTHNGEAILRLSHTTAMPSRFRALAEHGFDARFAFTTAEMLATLGARRAGPHAANARAALETALVPDSMGFAFTLDPNDEVPVPIAIADGCATPVSQILDAAGWARTFLAVGAGADPGTLLATATWSPTHTVVTWRAEDVAFVAFCGTRVASALLLDKLTRRLARGVAP